MEIFRLAFFAWPPLQAQKHPLLARPEGLLLGNVALRQACRRRVLLIAAKYGIQTYVVLLLQAVCQARSSLRPENVRKQWLLVQSLVTSSKNSVVEEIHLPANQAY